MASTYARILTSIWDDPEFVKLDPGAQRLYLLLLSQSTTDLAGCSPILVKRWARQSPNTSVRYINRHLNSLFAAKLVLLDNTTDELLVRSYVKHNAAMLKNINMRKAVIRDINKIKSKALRNALMKSLPDDVRAALATPLVTNAACSLQLAEDDVGNALPKNVTELKPVEVELDEPQNAKPEDLDDPLLARWISLLGGNVGRWRKQSEEHLASLLAVLDSRYVDECLGSLIERKTRIANSAYIVIAIKGMARDAHVIDEWPREAS